MFQQMKKRIQNEKGLTLIELLAVIVILAVIAAIAIPAIGNIIEKQREKAVLSDAQLIISGAKLAIADGACTGNTCTGTQLNPFIEGITLVDTDTVVKNGAVYTLTWASGETFTQISGASTSNVTEAQIQGWLD
ncbi:prepilin-type N-terminal cleavage/methylation domain-containing protein [Lysinibacillus sp. 3P01SB]|uniref:prepilin-type N-terminal cleavage/methylation domain-containing protein n=1 Tax=Lysinibacillus sp. 3P01SB TaxID=3132284 RepID=UPI0039A4868B